MAAGHLSIPAAGEHGRGAASQLRRRGGTVAPWRFGFVAGHPLRSLSLSISGSVEAAALEDGEPGRPWSSHPSRREQRPTFFFVFFCLFSIEKILTNAPLLEKFQKIDPDLGAMDCGAELTRHGAMDHGVEMVQFLASVC
jgi:hypothetical protein